MTSGKSCLSLFQLPQLRNGEPDNSYSIKLPGIWNIHLKNGIYQEKKKCRLVSDQPSSLASQSQYPIYPLLRRKDLKLRAGWLLPLCLFPEFSIDLGNWLLASSLHKPEAVAGCLLCTLLLKRIWTSRLSPACLSWGDSTALGPIFFQRPGLHPFVGSPGQNFEEKTN